MAVSYCTVMTNLDTIQDAGVRVKGNKREVQKHSSHSCWSINSVWMVMTLETELFPSKSRGLFSRSLIHSLSPLHFTLPNLDPCSLPPHSLLFLSLFLLPFPSLPCFQPISFWNHFGPELPLLLSFSDTGKVQPILTILSSMLLWLIISSLLPPRWFNQCLRSEWHFLWSHHYKPL